MRRAILMCGICATLLCCSLGCAKDYNVLKSFVAELEEPSNVGSMFEESSMFVVLEECVTHNIVYHKDEKVMYAVSLANYNKGNFTLLVNADGTPMLYEGEE